MQPSPNPKEQQETTLLVLLAQTGDRAALEQLLRESHAPLQRYITSLAGPDLADDILQETALQIFPQAPAPARALPSQTMPPRNPSGPRPGFPLSRLSATGIHLFSSFQK